MILYSWFAAAWYTPVCYCSHCWILPADLYFFSHRKRWLWFSYSVLFFIFTSYSCIQEDFHFVLYWPAHLSSWPELQLIPIRPWCRGMGFLWVVWDGSWFCGTANSRTDGIWIVRWAAQWWRGAEFWCGMNFGFFTFFMGSFAITSGE